MTEKVHDVPFDGEFRICPLCGYRDGFHSMFRQKGEGIQWLFICPSCHEIFDIGRRLPAS